MSKTYNLTTDEEATDENGGRRLHCEFSNLTMKLLVPN